MKMNLIEFSNPSKRDQNKKCCEYDLWGCKGDCDPIFEGCVSDKPTINGKQDCTLKYFRTKEYSNKNTVKFGGDLGNGIRNPIVMKRASAWKVSYLHNYMYYFLSNLIDFYQTRILIIVIGVYRNYSRSWS